MQATVGTNRFTQWLVECTTSCRFILKPRVHRRSTLIKINVPSVRLLFHEIPLLDTRDDIFLSAWDRGRDIRASSVRIGLINSLPEDEGEVITGHI